MTDSMKANISINKICIQNRFKIDSGSNVTIIYLQHWQRFKEKLKAENRKIPTLRKSQHKITTAGNNELPILGCFTGTLNAKHASFETTIYVANVTRKNPLLSAKLSLKLGFLMYSPEGDFARERDDNDESLIADNVELSHDAKAKIAEIQKKFKNVLQGIGKYNGSHFKIELKENFQPKCVPPRQTPVHYEQKLIKELKKMIEQEILEFVPEGESYQWSSPLNIVIKPGTGELRITTDFRLLNDNIIRYRSLQTPTLETFQRRLSGGKYFFKIDCNQAYHQLVVEKESRKLLTISTPLGNLRFCRVGQGLKNAGDFWDDTMAKVLSDCKRTVFFRDDIAASAETESELLIEYEKVMKALSDAGLTINPNKSVIGAKQIKFFGTIFSADGMRPDPEKIEALKNAPLPSGKKPLISLLCAAQWQDRYIPNFANITAILRDMTHQNAKFEWTTERLKAFHDLKAAMCKDALLTYFDKDKESALFVDAGKLSHTPGKRGGIGSVFCQLYGDTWRPIAFYSRRITDVMTRYGQIELESIAIVWSLKKFRYYILGSPSTVKIFTDAKSLIPFYNGKKRTVPPRIQRHLLEAQQYNIEVIWVPGSKQISDFLSRNGTLDDKQLQKQEECVALELAIEEADEQLAMGNLEGTFKEEFIRETLMDPELQFVRERITKHDWRNHKNHPSYKLYFPMRSELSVIGNLLYKGDKVIVPTNMRQRLTKKIHDHGHQGQVRSAELLKSIYFFPGLYATIKSTVEHCPVCQKVTFSRRKDPIDTEPTIPIANYKIAMDYHGPFRSGLYVLVIIDLYTRWVEAYYTTSTSFKALKPILKRYMQTHGDVYFLKSDQGSPFTSNEFKAFCKARDITPTPVTPLNPAANGEIERMMQLVNKCDDIAKAKKVPFRDILDEGISIYNSTKHKTTNLSPYEMVFHKQKRIGSIDPRPPQFFATRNLSHLSIAKHIDDIKERNNAKKNAKRNVKQHDFNVNEKVLLKEDRKNKYDFENIYTIIEVRGHSIIARRESDGRIVHRKPQFFKHYYHPLPEVQQEQQMQQQQVEQNMTFDFEDDVEEEIQPAVMPPNEPLLIPPAQQGGEGGGGRRVRFNPVVQRRQYEPDPREVPGNRNGNGNDVQQGVQEQGRRRPGTRSQGRALDLPNVMTRPLEYDRAEQRRVQEQIRAAERGNQEYAREHEEEIRQAIREARQDAQLREEVRRDIQDILEHPFGQEEHQHEQQDEQPQDDHRGHT